MRRKGDTALVELTGDYLGTSWIGIPQAKTLLCKGWTAHEVLEFIIHDVRKAYRKVLPIDCFWSPYTMRLWVICITGNLL